MENENKEWEDSPSIRERLKQIKAVVRSGWRIVISHLLFLAGPVVALFIVETLNEKNPVDNLNFQELWMNLVLYAVVWLIFWLVLGRRRRAAASATIFFFLAGLANHYVLKFKGLILFPNDIVGWRTALSVLDTYDLSPDRAVWIALDILLAYLALLWLVAVPQKKRELLRPRWLNLVPIVAAVAYCYMFFFSNWLIDAQIKTQQWKTQSNGWVLNFSLALRYSRVDKPKDYSISGVSALTEELSGEEGSGMALMDDPYLSTPFDPATEDKEGDIPTSVGRVSNDPSGVQPVNIICIMDESFGDLSVFEKLSTNEDAVPFYHGLTENTIKGWMYSPVTGGGTASVEYEFLTGNCITFLPPGTVAYQLYVKEHMPSLISWANALGFHTTTFHPYDATGWNRVKVYQDFGADTQLYKEDVEEPAYVRNYISDQCDFETIEAITSAEEGDQQFIFNVTMQNHGGYKQVWTNLPREVELTGAYKGVSEYAEQYLNLMRETDRALESLVDYYKSVDEPTLIVFFGDHQGKLSDWFYERLYGKELEERDMEELERQYAVPFFLWANYDISEAQDIMISTNYLGALTAQVSNYPTTGYMDFLAGLYESLPVLNKIGYAAQDGTLTDDPAELSDEVKEALERYRTLSYYNLFDRREDIDNRFFLPKG